MKTSPGMLALARSSSIVVGAITMRSLIIFKFFYPLVDTVYSFFLVCFDETGFEDEIERR